MLLGVDSASSEKDAVLAIVGASAALGGFALVFLGLLVTSYQGFRGTDRMRKLLHLVPTMAMTLVVFLEILACVAVGVAWLVAGGGYSLYLAVVGVFFIELVWLGGLAVFGALKMWKIERESRALS